MVLCCPYSFQLKRRRRTHHPDVVPLPKDHADVASDPVRALDSSHPRLPRADLLHLRHHPAAGVGFLVESRSRVASVSKGTGSK